MHDINKMQNKRQNPTTEGISYHIAENGKSWSYKDGKLHPGCYSQTVALFSFLVLWIHAPSESSIKIFNNFYSNLKAKGANGTEEEDSRNCLTCQQFVYG